MSVIFEILLRALHDSAVALVAGAIVPVIISIWENQKGRRELAYEVVSDREEPWQNGVIMRIILLRVWNSGNESIEPRHFDDRVTFTFGNGTLIESVHEEDKRPPNIILRFRAYTDKVELKPFLLKCKESFSLAFTLKKAQYLSLNVRGNIAILDVAVERLRLRTSVMQLYIASAFVFVGWIGFLVLHHKYITVEIFSVIPVVFALILAALITTSILKNIRRYQLS